MKRNYDIIVIGVSKGGLHALSVILEAFDTGMRVPIVIVQHRGKDSDDTLLNLLRGHCKLPIRSIFDKDEIQQGEVYIARPDYHLLIEDGHFAFSVEAPVCYARPSIDVLFESAAKFYGDKVIGVILTGSSYDGAKGLSLIKKSGGLTIVQDPGTAESNVMPSSAIEATKVDYILPLDSIGTFLADI